MDGMGPIKVLVVDDSLVAREHLQYIIESDPRLKVIGMAGDGEAALKWLEHHRPDVITMDIKMPKLDGLETTRRIMQRVPVPIVIVSGAYNSQDAEQSFRAMEAGALAILEKPVGGIMQASSSAKALVDTIKAVAGVKLITRRSDMPKASSATASLGRWHQRLDVVAIGASLGGPPALCTIISKLPPTFAAPIFIVQHIIQGFIEGLARWLSAASALPVHIARDGEQALAGHIYLAPDRCHMEVKPGNIVTLVREAPSSRPQPSVGRLFQSVADSYGAHAAAILLTGMGQDGAKELLTLRQRGALTIAQDEASSVMFGMPKEAIALGAAKLVLPLEEIGPYLIHITQHGADNGGF